MNWPTLWRTRKPRTFASDDFRRTGSFALGWVILLPLIAIVALVAVWFLQRYYAKASLDTALVRTGFGGCRVVTDGGCLSCPCRSCTGSRKCSWAR